VNYYIKSKWVQMVLLSKRSRLSVL